MQQEEFYERLVWLSAVVNDCNRVVEEQYCSPSRLIAESNSEGRRQHYNNSLLAQSTRELSIRAYESFKNCAKLAVKEMAKVIIALMATDPDFATVLKGDTLKTWEATLPGALDTVFKESTMAKLARHVVDQLVNAKGTMSDLCHHQLVDSCAMHVTSLYIFLLYSAHRKDKKYSPHGPEVMQLEKDLSVIINAFNQFNEHIHDDTHAGQYATNTYVSLNGLVKTIDLLNTESDLDHGKNGSQLQQCILYFINLVSRCPTSQVAPIANCVKHVLKLRYDYHTPRRKSFFDLGAKNNKSLSVKEDTKKTTDPQVLFVRETYSAMMEYSHASTDPGPTNTESQNNGKSSSNDDEDEQKDGITDKGMNSGMEAIAAVYQGLERSLGLFDIITEFRDLSTIIAAGDNTSSNFKKHELMIQGLKSSTLFMMNSTRQPHTYVRFSMKECMKDKIVYETAVKQNSLLPDWSKENIIFPMIGAARYLRVDLMCKNYIFSDELMGSIDVSSTLLLL